MSFGLAYTSNVAFGARFAAVNVNVISPRGGAPGSPIGGGTPTDMALEVIAEADERDAGAAFEGALAPPPDRGGGAAAGLAPGMTGAYRSMYRNPPASDPLKPPGFVTTTSTNPAGCAGTTQVIVVLFTTITLVAATPPTETTVSVAKFVPVIVTGMSPAVLVEFGVTLATVTAM